MRFAQAESWQLRLVRVLEVARSENDIAALRLVVDGLRPQGSGDPGRTVEALCVFLERADPEIPRELGAILRRVLGGARVYPALTSSGVPGGEGFFPELVARVTRKALPTLPDPTDLRDLVRRIFGARGDHHWVDEVPDALWRRLLTALGITAESVRGVDEELALALRVLAHHAASLGLQPEVTSRVPRLEDPDSPFLNLGQLLLRYLESFENEVEGDEVPLLDEALAGLAACRAEVDRIREGKRETGTSLWFTQLTFRLRQILDRIELLLHLTEPVERDFQGCAVRLFKQIVHAEKTRDQLVPHVRSSADLLALEIVEHAARKGSKYITTGRRDYGLFFVSSLGGGLLVAIFSLAKVIMGQWEVPLGVEALLYGINYSLCFVLIYLTGATLATKQPAMTANTLARSLGQSGHEMKPLEELIVRVWRSQFVSFVGNLAMALPVALGLSYLVHLGTGEVVASPEKARTMLANLHPWRSGTIAYAAVAGVLLFASGIVSGWIENWNRHRQIPDRVAHHPWLIAVLGPRGAMNVAQLIDKKLGAVVGNVFLGFGLGSMGTLGEILGLPLDIRHIAFASAELGTSLEILGTAVPPRLVVEVGIGVALIGLVNFLVSFGLSLAVALESRGVTFRETRLLVRHLGERLVRRPLDWFFPPKEAGAAGGGL